MVAEDVRHGEWWEWGWLVWSNIYISYTHKCIHRTLVTMNFAIKMYPKGTGKPLKHFKQRRPMMTCCHQTVPVQNYKHMRAEGKEHDSFSCISSVISPHHPEESQ